MTISSQAAITYITSKVAGAVIAWTQPKQIDGIAFVKVKFWHNGQAFFADVWSENGSVYGEW